jgi:hypothetical protein
MDDAGEPPLIEITEPTDHRGEEDLHTESNPDASTFYATEPHEVIEPGENDLGLVVDDLVPVSFRSDSDVDAIVFNLMGRATLPSPEWQAKLPEILEERRLEALMNGDYDTAEHQDKIMGTLQSLIQKAEQKQSEERSIDMLYQRWQHLQTKQQEITSRWDTKIRELLEESETQRLALQSKHDEELEQFIAKWKDPGFLRPFNKPSPKLIQLREQERAMGLSRMYAKAKETKGVADRLQREETQAAQSRINAQMASERHTLGVKQEKELISLAAHRDRTVKAMQGEKARELKPVTMAIQQIKAKKSAVPKMPSSLPSLPTARADSGSTAGHSQEGSGSPGTQARYAHFRSEKRQTLLDVAPVDDQVIAQMKKPLKTRAKTSIRNRAK